MQAWNIFTLPANLQMKALLSKFAQHPVEQAHLLGQQFKHALKSNWLQIRDSIMLQAMQAKFCQNQALKQQLLDTGALAIVQLDTDTYWGCHVNDLNQVQGENRAGKLLEQVRSILQV